MIETVGRIAVLIDAWLREHVGRAYSGILGVGLVLGLIATFSELGKELGSGVSVLKIAGLVAFQAVLLINQLAQFHDYRTQRKQRRAERRAPPPLP